VFGASGIFTLVLQGPYPPSTPFFLLPAPGKNTFLTISLRKVFLLSAVPPLRDVLRFPEKLAPLFGGFFSGSLFLNYLSPLFSLTTYSSIFRGGPRKLGSQAQLHVSCKNARLLAGIFDPLHLSIFLRSHGF